MEQLAAFVTVLGAGIQVGSILFFSFVLTPTLFGNLTREEAGRAVRVCFPAYYATTSAAVAAALMAALSTHRSGMLILALASALGAQSYAGLRLLPRMLKARAEVLDPESPDESDPAAQEWRRLHTLSMQINLAALSFGLVALWFAIR